MLHRLLWWRPVLPRLSVCAICWETCALWKWDSLIGRLGVCMVPWNMLVGARCAANSLVSFVLLGLPLLCLGLRDCFSWSCNASSRWHVAVMCYCNGHSGVGSLHLGGKPVWIKVRLLRLSPQAFRLLWWGRSSMQSVLPSLQWTPCCVIGVIALRR